MGRKAEARFHITAVDKTKEAMKSVRSNMARLNKTVAPLIPAFTTLAGGVAIGAFVKSSLDAGDKIQKLAIRLGASTEALSEYEHVAQLTGVRNDTLIMGWQRMTRRVAEAAQGTGEAQGALKELGLNVQDLAQLAPEDQFEAIADAMSHVEKENDKVRLAMKLFDSEGVSLLQTMEGGSDALKTMRQEARELGMTLDRETADKMASANDAVTNIAASIRGTGVTLASAFAPAIIDVADLLTSATNAAGDFLEEITESEMDRAIKKMRELGSEVEDIERMMVLRKLSETQRSLTQTSGGLAKSLAKIGKAVDFHNEKVSDGTHKIARFGTSYNDLAGWMNKTTEMVGRDAVMAVEDFNDQWDANEQKIRSSISAYEDIGIDIESTWESMEKLARVPDQFNPENLEETERIMGLIEGQYRTLLTARAKGETGPEWEKMGDDLDTYYTLLSDYKNLLEIILSLQRDQDNLLKGDSLDPDDGDSKPAPSGKRHTLEEQRELNKLMAEGARVTAAMRTPLEIYEDDMERLTKLLMSASISQETYNRAVEASEKTFKDSLEKSTGETVSHFDLLQDEGIKVLDSLDAHMAGFLMNAEDGWESLRNMALQALNDISAALIRQFITQPLIAGLTGWMNPSGGASTSIGYGGTAGTVDMPAANIQFNINTIDSRGVQEVLYQERNMITGLVAEGFRKHRGLSR
ncbi:MAG: hypothetical protein GY835_05730 [bacterium]|nr:hypothetical protein [bacterium]